MYFAHRPTLLPYLIQLMDGYTKPFVEAELLGCVPHILDQQTDCVCSNVEVWY